MKHTDALLCAHKLLLTHSLEDFTTRMFLTNNKHPYIVAPHHRLICQALDKVISGEINRLIINIAPRYGKTLLVSQYFIAYGLALNPKSIFLHLSYSTQLAQANSVATKEIVKSPYYQAVFGNTQVREGEDTKSKWLTTQGGAVYATSTLGQVTGFGAGLLGAKEFSGAIIIDDPIKPEDAFSDIQRQAVNRRFETTIRSRLNDKSTPIVIIMQRLHENDLCGYLTANEPNTWTVLSIPCITDSGEALWPYKHTLMDLKRLQDTDPITFETQYMQNPIPLEGLLYTKLQTYEVLPEKGIVKAYIDTADTGADYFCCIIYKQTKQGYCYVLDVLYTKKPMEYTEQLVPTLLTKYQTDKCYIEGNNGGRGFCRTVENRCRELRNYKTDFVAFHQSANKNTRIFSCSSQVQNMIFFPVGWEVLYPEFARDVKSYRKEGRNAHDDAPDALTGVIEKIEMRTSVPDIDFIRALE